MNNVNGQVASQTLRHIESMDAGRKLPKSYKLTLESFATRL